MNKSKRNARKFRRDEILRELRRMRLCTIQWKHLQIVIVQVLQAAVAVVLAHTCTAYPLAYMFKGE